MTLIYLLLLIYQIYNNTCSYKCYNIIDQILFIHEINNLTFTFSYPKNHIFQIFTLRAIGTLPKSFWMIKYKC